MDSWTFYILFFIFVALVLFVIIKRHVSQSSFSEYTVANRSAGTFVFTFSFAGRWFVGSIFTVWFVMAAETGIYALYLVIYTIGAILMLRLFGVPISKLGSKYNLETQADFIYLRYGNKPFKMFFSSLTLLFWVPWVILELKTIGNAVVESSGHGLEYNISIIVVTMLIIICCFYGGVRSVNNGAIVQASVVFIVGVGCSLFLIYKIFGGLTGMFDEIQSTVPEMLTLNVSPGNRYDWLSATISGALGSIMWPGMFTLIYTAKNTGVIKKGSIYAVLLLVPPTLLVLMLGIGAGVMPDHDPSDLVGIFKLAAQYGNGLILSLLGIGTVAASMSMCAAVFNVAGIIIAKDINPYYNDNKRNRAFKVAKVATVSVGLIALWIATIDVPNLASIVFLMYSFIIQTSGPIMLGLIWKRSNLYGAVFGMLAGILTTLVVTVFPEIVIATNGLSAGIIGLLANFAVHILVSLITPEDQNWKHLL